jgi:hypothetical protein
MGVQEAALGGSAFVSRRERAPMTGPEHDVVRRDILPIPDVTHVGLTTYDAKDADHYIDPDERFRIAMARH